MTCYFDALLYELRKFAASLMKKSSIMKRFCTFLFILSTIIFTSFADDVYAAAINLQHQGQDDHFEHLIPADMPEAYYNSSTQEIILVADGFASYYDVEIYPAYSAIPVITTQVDGYGDTIDVSSLPADNYTIVITSEYNNVFEGEFTIE